MTIEPPLTVAEDVQPMLTQLPGRLEADRVIPVAGALIELVLLGRISSVEKKRFFVDPIGRLLTVVDPSPTGVPLRDIALGELAGGRATWRVDRALLAISDAVVAAVHESLESRGLTRSHAGPGRKAGYLEIVDGDRVTARRDVLARARMLPDTVSDPRLRAVVDLLRRGGNQFRGETGSTSASHATGTRRTTRRRSQRFCEPRGT